jgi:8-oxo-dGTP diphosphatase
MEEKREARNSLRANTEGGCWHSVIFHGLRPFQFRDQPPRENGGGAARAQCRSRFDYPAPTLRTILVSAAVLIEEGRVLLTQRKAGAHLEGKWEFPGGKVEPGEDPREALRRELREELGIESTIGEILEVTSHRYVEADRTVVLLFFLATRTPDSPAVTALDVAAFEWATRDGLDPARFPPADVNVLTKVGILLEES